MRSYLKRLVIFFTSIAVVPFLAGVIGTFSFGFGLFMALLGLPTAALVLMIGTVVWFVEGIRQARQSSERAEQLIAIAASPILCAMTILAAWPMLSAGRWVGDLTQLNLNRSHYETIIAKVRAGHAGSEDGGVTYTVDSGPPIRIAFNPQGLLDNWSGIIFDPTGDVMQANGFNASGKLVAPKRITELFGGDLVRCRHLVGDYYSCSFT